MGVERGSIGDAGVEGGRGLVNGEFGDVLEGRHGDCQERSGGRIKGEEDGLHTTQRSRQIPPRRPAGASS